MSKPHLWKKGQSGNPAGKPEGSRNKLTEAFWRDFAAAWEAKGKAALEQVAQDHPETFVRVAGSLMPKDINLTHTVIEQVRQMSDDALDEAIKRLASGTGGTLSETAVVPADDGAGRTH